MSTSDKCVYSGLGHNDPSAVYSVMCTMGMQLFLTSLARICYYSRICYSNL